MHQVCLPCAGVPRRETGAARICSRGGWPRALPALSGRCARSHGRWLRIARFAGVGARRPFRLDGASGRNQDSATSPRWSMRVVTFSGDGGCGGRRRGLEWPARQGLRWRERLEQQPKKQRQQQRRRWRQQAEGRRRARRQLAWRSAQQLGNSNRATQQGRTIKPLAARHGGGSRAEHEGPVGEGNIWRKHGPPSPRCWYRIQN